MKALKKATTKSAMINDYKVQGNNCSQMPDAKFQFACEKTGLQPHVSEYIVINSGD